TPIHSCCARHPDRVVFRPHRAYCRASNTKDPVMAKTKSESKKTSKRTTGNTAPAASPSTGSMAPGVDIGIPDRHRQKIAEDLGHFLSDSFTLYLKTHNFHWNVTGPMFNSLHAMFMDQYTEQWN